VPAEALNDVDRLFLRRLQRATWAFFAEFVTEEANYLAPDNFQETPRPVVAYRTSPTNIGLQMLADLAAHDAGYIGLIELTERTRRVLATIAQLPHANGHLLNWYDTRTLEPLPPAYVSTVDSGNLAAALLTLRQGYLELADTPVLGSWVLAGLQDTFALVQEQLGNDSQLKLRLGGLATVLTETPGSCADYRRVLQQVQQQARAITLPASAGIWLERLVIQAESLLTDINTLLPDEYSDRTPPTLQQLAEQLNDAPHNYARELRHQHCEIAAEVLREFEGMDFAFLYDSRRRLFTIGYNLAEGRRDASYYDLLASEARLASFLAIATGAVPQQHWFALGRTLLDSGAGSVLASWSGTMFEYLMPLLFMRSYPDTLIDTTYQVAVDRQIQYGEEQQLPWGVSESAYAARDPAMNYQYRAFGVPGLGLKRGLSGELVVAPYASVLALPVRTTAAIANLQQLISIGMQGQYGLYEAIDYTRDRVPPGADHAIIRSYMVHHQGMSLLALANLLQDNRFQERFHAERLVQATEMLLQEKIPADAPLSQPEEAAEEKTTILLAPPTPRVVSTPTTAVPYTHLLSNGNYTVMLTNAGGGYSSSGDLAVTRWHSDPTRDNWGSFIYIRDIRSNLLWSAAYQPTCHTTQEYRVTFGLDKVELRQVVAGIETRMEVTVSPEDAVEVRRITLTNLTSAPRELELTSYAEIVLAPAAADAAHPAFSNLFVETEYVASHEALLASRRPRSADAPRPWALHVTAVRGHASSSIEYETDRAAFVGRGHTTADPQALTMALSQQTGAVLDPIFSLRRRMRIVPGGSAQIIYVTGTAENREHALQLANKYRNPEAATRAFSMAWTQAQVELRHLRITADDAQRYQRLASGINYLDTQKRAATDVLARNARGQNGLWAYGISGDLPIMLVSVTNSADLSLVQELLQAHQYWRLKRLAVDLVILNEEPGGYLQLAQDQLLNLVRSSGWYLCST
jgi:cyclic beta-1,2-glucan synthetase